MSKIPTCEQLEQLLIIGAIDRSMIDKSKGEIVEKSCDMCGEPVFMGMKLYSIIKHAEHRDYLKIRCKKCTIIPTGG